MIQLAIVFSLLGYTPPEWTSKYDRFEDITMMMSSIEGLDDDDDEEIA